MYILLTSLFLYCVLWARVRCKRFTNTLLHYVTLAGHCHWQVVELDLGKVVPCCSGPKMPHDKVPVSIMKSDFEACLNNKVGRKVRLVG